MLAAPAVAAAKVTGGLALALARPWGQLAPRRWLLTASAGTSALLVAYDGLNVLAGARVLAGAVHPPGSADRTALRWHAGVWDLWVPGLGDRAGADRGRHCAALRGVPVRTAP